MRIEIAKLSVAQAALGELDRGLDDARGRVCAEENGQMVVLAEEVDVGDVLILIPHLQRRDDAGEHDAAQAKDGE
jgi:hypothetical protein